ncbi:hypothetical protein LGR97_20100 [Klebsiella quasipneumoniae subsp. similipneumoniae]|uniref:hypothetical protein n=1 Tax=Klebsiella quasipneumoniae TaxID=1463165 RepID=UPI001F1ECAAD|nr:hypothetical protein [Klebsiella quasipneumoniae]MCF2309366.1 hypothetical protein [Klebsiella quasipneumoniae subsp. similipneumoniae]MCF2309920.1 hypothetical protein [Klebsiella quasipneumoniae subsp. similipneumoniae]MCF2311841.1 hypothetical protein [Klebsiella quasipneumoniae subsp. similipneumoniae]HBT6275022.1 hypothetical protein [Klebsiella quasipneumoniae]HDE1081970.1 hypothetical protein [Klebsiella quasipneumoniae]
MTDITELAQSLKNAASKALIEEGLTWFSEEQLSHEDGISLHKADAEFISLANPANVLALVEALEENTAGVAGMAESYETIISMLRSRIAELESRTITVKLPEPPGPMSVGARTVYFGIVSDVVGAFQDALRDAGIKVEDE